MRSGAAPAPTMLAHNYLRLAGAEAVVKLLTLAAFTWLARTLGPERYGGLEFAVATIAFFALVVDYGLNDYATRPDDSFHFSQLGVQLPANRPRGDKHVCEICG